MCKKRHVLKKKCLECLVTLFEYYASSGIDPICQETCTSWWEALKSQHRKKYSKIRDGLRKKKEKERQKKKKEDKEKIQL